MFVYFECCVLSGRGLCDGLITRPEEAYRLWYVVCDLENAWMRRPWPTGGCHAINKRHYHTPKSDCSNAEQTFKRVFTTGATLRLPAETRIDVYLRHTMSCSCKLDWRNKFIKVYSYLQSVSLPHLWKPINDTNAICILYAHSDCLLKCVLSAPLYTLEGQWSV
jgi:hypothetical protein